jgi:stress responsive alpha/beta barrel protein
MMRAGIAFAVLSLLGATVLMPSATAAEKVLRHIVMYKFKDDASPAQIKEVIDAFAALPKKVDTIIAFEHGANVSTEGKSEGFTHVFVVTFKSEADLAAYLVHPAHQAYVKVVLDRREKVVVFDYWAER